MNDLLGDPIITLSAEQIMTDRELLESIHVMLVTLTSKKPKATGVPKARHEYDPEFERLWKAYPARSGSNPKWKAQQCWRARAKEAEGRHTRLSEIYAMFEGVERYSKWCEATGKTGTEMVMQTARFLGPGMEYKSVWTLPAPDVQVIKIPANGDDLVAFAANYGIKPRPGESWFDLRKRVESAVEASLGFS